MNFRLINLYFHSCHHFLVTLFILFYYHHIFIFFLAFIIICFILSILFLGLMILHILVQRGQSYHSIHPIIWYWFEDFSLRGCFMGWVHVFISDLREFVHSLYLSHWSSIYWWSKHTQSKKTKTKKIINKEKAQWYVHIWNLSPLGTYVTFWGSFIGYICHCGFLWDFYMSFHSLSYSCYVFGVSRVHERVLWDPMLLGSRLICIRYERWVTYESWVTFY